MRVSLNWLKRFIDLKDTPKDIVNVFIKLGIEIESVEYKGLEKNDAVVVGKILSFEKHPNADRLSVCQVDIGDGNLCQIVCGASNFKQNDCVPVALPGAILSGDVKIKQSKLRGIDSEGMMCSGRELGLDSDHSGLLILGQNHKLGTKIHDIFSEHNVIFELKLTANRGDALSHYGIARELAAWYNISLKPIVIPHFTKNLSKTEYNQPKLEVDSLDCAFYSAIVLKNIKIRESVEWIRRDLESVGIATINNIVDITNWIMLAYGQPLHAFDRTKIGKEIIIRKAMDGEKIRTLNGKEYEVTPNTLLICDENHPLAIAGVIGGASTRVTEMTTEIILESACFSADNIRKTTRALAINTDSAHRYVHHVDPAQTENFLKVAVQMIMDLYGAEPVSEIIKVSQNVNFSSKKIELRLDFVRKVFGFFVQDDVILDLLTRLQYSVHQKDHNTWVVESPSYRWDVIRPIDLVEECLRIYGVDKIPTTNTKIKIGDKMSICSAQKKKKMIQFLADNGFIECYNYSLGKEMENALPVANFLIEKQTHLRTSLIPGLIDAFQYNLQNGNKYAKFFEFGHVFQKSESDFEELISIAFLIPTESFDKHWEKFDRPTFFEAKNLIQQLWNIITDKIFGPIKFFANPLFEEKHAAKIGDLGKMSMEAHVGYLNSEKVKEFQIPLIAGEILTNIPFFQMENKMKKYHPFSYYPAAKRDISLILDRDCPAQSAIDEIQEMVKSIAEGIFTNIEVNIFDVYCGENLPEQKKSLGLNLSFKNDKKTPSDTDIDRVFEELVSMIKRHSRFALRG